MSSNAREAKERLLAIRIPQSLLDAIDEQVEHMRVDVPWVSTTRSDVVRWMLTASVERVRAERLVRDRRDAEPDARAG